MAISFKKYIDIVSGVGGATAVRERELILRLMVDNPKVPVDAVVEITSASEVGAYFGTTSEEYKRAVLYFGFVSKNISRAKKISFGRYAKTATAPKIFGDRVTTLLSALQAITAGTLTMTAGANTVNLTAINFSSATSFADVASLLQTKIRTATGTQFTTATVAYDAVAGTFNFTGSVAAAAPVSVTVTGSGTDIALLVGWGPAAVFSPGVDATSAVDSIIASTGISNNCGSFVFAPLGVLTDADVVAVAAWNQTQNVDFLYSQGVTDTNRVALAAALLSVGGVALTYMPNSAEYDDMVPPTVLAATDYSRRNSTQNYMFQNGFDLTPKVTTDALSNALDLDRVNYIGVTQTAGQLISFYQRGVMGGGTTELVDQNVYANEMWLKDACAATLMGLLLAKAKVSANAQGRGEVITILQDAIDRALFNGTISVGKPLSVIQRVYITEQTGDDLAYLQVQSIGYWLDCVMASSVTQDGRTEWSANYTLIYSKDDVVRKVNGTHVLI